MANSDTGIASPCSSCKNQRSVPDPNGRQNVCPRRNITAKYLFDMSGTSTQQAYAAYYQPLTLTGTSDSPSLTANLKNPVYDSATGSVQVWVALLKDNPALIDVNGNTINPQLTDPGFDTDYIVCRTIPFTPNSDEHGYFMKGAIQEGEPVVIHESNSQYTADGTQLVCIAGTVDRASYIGSIPRNPVIEDNSPEGT